MIEEIKDFGNDIKKKFGKEGLFAIIALIAVLFVYFLLRGKDDSGTEYVAANGYAGYPDAETNADTLYSDLYGEIWGSNNDLLDGIKDMTNSIVGAITSSESEIITSIKDYQPNGDYINDGLDASDKMFDLVNREDYGGVKHTSNDEYANLSSDEYHRILSAFKTNLTPTNRGNTTSGMSGKKITTTGMSSKPVNTMGGKQIQPIKSTSSAKSTPTASTQKALGGNTVGSGAASIGGNSVSQSAGRSSSSATSAPVHNISASTSFGGSSVSSSSASRSSSSGSSSPRISSGGGGLSFGGRR